MSIILSIIVNELIEWLIDTFWSLTTLKTNIGVFKLLILQ